MQLDVLGRQWMYLDYGDDLCRHKNAYFAKMHHILMFNLSFLSMLWITMIYDSSVFFIFIIFFCICHSI